MAMGRLRRAVVRVPVVGGFSGFIAMSALIACGIASDDGAPTSPTTEPTGDLPIVACPGSGPLLAVADPGQRMLVTGRSADGAWLRVHVPSPVSNEGWVPAAAVDLLADPIALPTVACGASEPASGEAAGFRVVSEPDEPATPLGPPPSDELIQLVSFNKDDLPGRLEAAPWWSSAGIPRVDHITQFDAGPLQGGNAAPAAGAMLARLGFGIVTTGSQLRALESDQEGGTSLGDLAEALADRWDINVSEGYLASADLRELLSSGAGAVIIVNYGVLPIAERQQADFVGSHAIYVDAFRPASSTDPAAYYVLDPMGVPWHGYHGDWWPADIVDRAAMDVGGRRIVALWAFAGGLNPAARPSGAGAIDAPIGDEPSPNTPRGANRLLVQSASLGGIQIEPILGICVELPTPAYCPAGLPAVYDPPATGLDSIPPSGGVGPLELLYTDVPQPGVWRTILEAPADVEPTFSYWPADGTGPVMRADLVLATLGGKQVWMVTVPIPQAGTYYGVAVAHGMGGVVTATDVGAISFGN